METLTCTCAVRILRWLHLDEISWYVIGREVVRIDRYVHRLNHTHDFAELSVSIHHENVQTEIMLEVTVVLKVIQTYTRELHMNHRDMLILSPYEAQCKLLRDAIIHAFPQL